MKTRLPDIASEDQEWLLPLGQGGYASGNVSGCASRSYHGWLVAALPPPQDRILMLSHVDAEIRVPGQPPVSLASHVYGESVRHPRGDRYLTRFEPRPPSWCWQGPGFRFELTLEPCGNNGIRASYQLLALPGSSVVLRPFIACRSHHGGESSKPSIDSSCSTVSFEPPSPYALELQHELDGRPSTLEHLNFRYENELDRGLNGFENKASPCELHWAPEKGHGRTQISFLLAGEEEPLTARHSGSRATRMVERLREALRDFLIVNPADGMPGIIAGYPWFNEWGRDTMISLPGAVLATSDTSFGEQVLLAWSRRLRQGLLPNRLAEDSTTVGYNSADAPLWFVHAARRLLSDCHEQEPIRRAVVEIAESYVAGTEHGIGVDQNDGLLKAGSPSTQLTWMDACHEGHCFTPRWGKCVELNALLYETLLFASECSETQSLSRRFLDSAARLKESFAPAFVAPSCGLQDCLSDQRPRLRPNQLIALSLDHALVDQESANRAFDLCTRELLVPYGLRTLAPSDADYIGSYRGGPESRDSAYHQGTAWLWLLGPYIDAMFRVHGEHPWVRAKASQIVGRALSLLDRGCLGQLPEIVEGDAPHRPVGTPAQAWSSAELYRVIHDWELDEDVIQRFAEDSG